MRTRRKATITELRLAVGCLRSDTQVAILDGIRSNSIIVGAYTTRDGICLMLAADRAGARTNCIAFARAWERFAFRGAEARVARRATGRELRVLAAHLEATLLEDDPPLSAGNAEHRATVAEHQRLAKTDSERLGDPEGDWGLEHGPGSSSMRVVGLYDEYERALARLQAEARPRSSDQPERQPATV
jgi:hypothetical protein